MGEVPARTATQRRLEGLVRDNRFTIAVTFPVVGAVLLYASARGWLPEPLAFNPLLVLAGVAVMRLPLVAGTLPLFDRRAALSVGALVAYAYAIELIGVHTGIPYGEFSYGVNLGPMVEGVPLGLPVFFLPLVLNSYLLAALLLGERARRGPLRLGTTLATVLIVDLVLDPGAVALGFWTYAGGGIYYGVPLSNYAGWVLSGAIAVGCFDLAFERTALLDRLDRCPFMLDDLVSFVILWGGLNAAFGNWIPVALAGALCVGLVSTGRFDFDVLPASVVRAVRW